MLLKQDRGSWAANRQNLHKKWPFQHLAEVLSILPEQSLAGQFLVISGLKLNLVEDCLDSSTCYSMDNLSKI